MDNSNENDETECKKPLLEKEKSEEMPNDQASINSSSNIYDFMKTLTSRIFLIVFVLFACLLSVSVATKIRFTPVVSHALLVHFKNKFPKNQIQWVGRLYAIVVLCLLPTCTALVDGYMLSYRFCLIVSGLLQIIASITSSTVTHPLFFVLTDSVLCGIGSALTFAVFILAIDDIFPKGHRFRVLATTLCQGSTIGTVFLLDFYSYLAHYYGWVYFQLFLAILFGIISGVLIITCPERGFKFRVRHRYTIPNSSDISSITTIKLNKLLGLTFEELSNSPSLFSWLIYRFIINIIHQGILILILKDSKLISVAQLDILFKSSYPTIWAVLSYGCGEILMYVLGAIFGGFLLGYLLHINVIFICILFLLLIIWQPIRLQFLNNGTLILGNTICAALTGCSLGALNTCLIAISEEATMIRGKRVFPFVKLLEGLSFTLTPFFFEILNQVSAQNIWLLTFAVLAAIDACLLVYIIHKIYNHYVNDKKSQRQVSMKPAQFLTKAFDTE